MPDDAPGSTFSLTVSTGHHGSLHDRLDETLTQLVHRLRVRPGRRQADFNHFYRDLKKQLRILRIMDDTEYAEHITRLHYAMVRDGLTREHICQSFALVFHAIKRELRMRPYKIQLLGAWLMMQGMLAEMTTGEGKTLTACFPACTAALAKIPVHIVTVSDYLAARDARLLQPVYQALGLTVGVVSADMSEAQRRSAYACHITYGTSKQFAGDYLRDRLSIQDEAGKPPPTAADASAPLFLPQGLCYAIIDDADTVLLDHAQIPLVLTRQPAEPASPAASYRALALARLLIKGEDFGLSPDKSKIKLTPQGQQRLSELIANIPTEDTSAHTRQLVLLALRTLHILQKDKHYLVKEQNIQRIDEHSGHAPRDWDAALRQMLQCKEGCIDIAEASVLARTSMQAFFRRYLHLAAMSGTARETTAELWRTYKLEVVNVPTRKPCRRRRLPERIYPHTATKWLAGVKRIEKIHHKRRPILVCTQAVSDADSLSRLLTRARLPHQVLYGRQDEEEAKIIALAGKSSQITVISNMAAQGTDIRLLRESKKAGGLHVILMELHDEPRLDRQLYERAGRQGNWGSGEAILSLDDPLFSELPSLLRVMLQRSWPAHRYLPLWLARQLIRLAQWSAQRHHIRRRRQLQDWCS